jgi:ribosomal protein S27AE
MPRARCPLCESPVRIEEMKPYSRLSCGKCHATLHLSKDRRLLLGDPPDVATPIQELQREFRRFVDGIPIRKLVTGLALFLVVVFGLYQLFGPAERLEVAAAKAAQALADGDPDTLESLAAADTSKDVRRWYDSAHPRLVQLRTQWGGRAEVVAAHVSQEDREQRKGSVGIVIQGAVNGARDVSLADPSISTAGASGPFEEVTDWTLSRWGRWRLDGRASLARLPQNRLSP